MADGRQHVVFLNIPGTGHMNPTLPVVAELRARGVEVTYFVPEMMREVVEAAGATWRSMQDPEKFTEEQLARYFPEGTPKADKEFPVSVIPMAATSLPGFISDLTALQPPPTAIVYDPFLPQGLVAAKHLGIPCIGSVTITGPGAIQLPPFLIKEWESKEPICRGRREIQDRYQFDIFEHGILMQFYSPDQNFVSTIDSLYLPPSSPVQLDRFGHFPFHCVGPLLNPEVKRVTHAKAGVIAGESKRSFPWEEVDAALAASKKVVLISLGTVANSAFWSKPFGPHAAKNGLHETTGKEFVQFVIGRVFEALGQEEDLLAVLVTGPQQDALEGLPAPPKNFILQETVPQLELLPKCHAFVTHGGANSMHESLRFGIPMAVVPMFGDQPGNADAVAERGAGFSFRNPLDSLTASAFRSAVTQLLAPEDANPFLATVQSMSKEMLQAGGVQLACELILETAANRPSKLGGA